MSNLNISKDRWCHILTIIESSFCADMFGYEDDDCLSANEISLVMSVLTNNTPFEVYENKPFEVCENKPFEVK